MIDQIISAAVAETVGATDSDVARVRRSSDLWPTTVQDLALMVAEAVTLQALLPDTVRATTIDHVVTLGGVVDRSDQRDDAGRAAERLNCVRLVVNTIVVRPRSPAVDPAGTASSRAR